MEWMNGKLATKAGIKLELPWRGCHEGINFSFSVVTAAPQNHFFKNILSMVFFPSLIRKM